MSIRELFGRNYNTLHAKKLIVDDIEALNFIVNDIITTNAEVTNLNAVNASGVDLNYTNATFTNLSSANGNISDLTSANGTIVNLESDTGVIDNLSGTNINYTNATFDNITVTGPFNLDTISGTNLTYTNGTITNFDSNVSNIGVGIITIASGDQLTFDAGNIPTLIGTTINYPNATFSSVNGNSLTYDNGSITQLNGDNVQYNTGTIGTLNGTDITYDVGYFPNLSCKELRIFTSLIECPSANINILTSDSVSVLNLLSSPQLLVDDIQTYSGTTINLNNTVVGLSSIFNTDVRTPIVYTNTLTTTSGAGNIAVNRPLQLPAYPGFVQQPFDICTRQSNTLLWGGTSINPGQTINASFSRIGYNVTFSINTTIPALISSGVSGTLTLTIPSPYNLPQTTASGVCIMAYAGVNYPLYYRYTQGTSVINFSYNFENNQVNSGVGGPIVPAASTFSILGFSMTYTQ